MTKLPDLPPVQGTACRAGEHGAVAEFGANLGGPAAQPAERSVLGVAQSRDGAAQAPSGLFPLAVYGQLLADLEDRERRPLVVAEHQVALAGRDHLDRDFQGHRNGPRRSVRQRAALGDGRQISRGHEAAQRLECSRGQQLQVCELRLTRCPRGPVR